jgi:hypothetical protein
MSVNDELSGTFAVDDHLRQRAFVAETVLFDRLIVPRPPPDDEEQYAEWVAAGWRPKELEEKLAALEDLAIGVPHGRSAADGGKRLTSQDKTAGVIRGR